MSGDASATVRVSVNGEARTFLRGSTIADVVRALALRSEQVAVEQNKRLVRRAEHASSVIADGDRLEVVTFFGGG